MPNLQTAEQQMIPEFKRILVGLDFSACSRDVARFGYSIADVGAEVHLVHVIERDPMPNPLYAHYTIDELSRPEKRREAEESVFQRLSGLVPATAADKRIVTSCKVVFDSDVADGLLEHAGALGADALVVGRHGKGALWDLLVGSVAERVLRRSKVPVLIVPSAGS